MKIFLTFSFGITASQILKGWRILLLKQLFSVWLSSLGCKVFLLGLFLTLSSEKGFSDFLMRRDRINVVDGSVFGSAAGPRGFEPLFFGFLPRLSVRRPTP